MSKKISAYGFGAQPVRNSDVSHCFALNRDIFNPEVDGIENLQKAIERSFDEVFFKGPTDPSDVINEVAARAKASQNNEHIQQRF